MVGSLLALAFALGCVASPSQPESAGILAYGEEGPAVYSLTQWGAGRKLRAYRIGHLSESVEVTIKDASRVEDSPLYDADGANVGWRHTLAEPHKIPRGAIWVCLPVGWKVRPTGPESASVQGADGAKGVVSTKLAQEGIQVVVAIGQERQKLYYYLGFDVDPAQE